MARRQLYFSLSAVGYVVGGRGGHLVSRLIIHQATSDSSGIVIVW
jgi:hypothetical protein